MNLISGLTALCLMASNAESQHAIETGQGIICDNREQITKIFELDGTKEAVDAVNSRNPRACTYAEVGYIRGATYGQVHGEKGAYEITEILVFGFKTGGEWHQMPPLIQWTAFPVAEEHV